MGEGKGSGCKYEKKKKAYGFLFPSHPLTLLFFLKAYLHNFMNHFLISDGFSLACSRFPLPFLPIMKVSPACRLGSWLWRNWPSR